MRRLTSLRPTRRATPEEPEPRRAQAVIRAFLRTLERLDARTAETAAAETAAGLLRGDAP